MPPKSKDTAKKRGRKPANKVVVPNQHEDQDEDEAEFLLKMELIKLVQGYPCIYDIADPMHSKTWARDNTWKKITEALFISGNIYTLNQFHINKTRLGVNK